MEHHPAAASEGSRPLACEPLVVVVADTAEERLSLTAGIPASSPILLVRDVTQARQVLAQLPGASPSRRSGPGRTSPARHAAPSRGHRGAGVRPPRRVVEDGPEHRADPMDQVCSDEPIRSGVAAPLQLREDRLSLTAAGREVMLTRLEFALLQHLLPRMGEVATFEQLSQVGWRTPYLGNGAHMHAAVGRLRLKLAELGVPVELEAVRGLGFRLVGHRPTPAVQEAVGN